MATQTKNKSNRVAKRASESRRANQVMSTPVAEFNEQAAERVAALSERAVDSGRKAGAAYLSSCAKAVLAGADSYEKAAGLTKLDGVAGMARAQADFARACTNAYGRAARELVS